MKSSGARGRGEDLVFGSTCFGWEYNSHKRCSIGSYYLWIRFIHQTHYSCEKKKKSDSFMLCGHLLPPVLLTGFVACVADISITRGGHRSIQGLNQFSIDPKK